MIIVVSVMSGFLDMLLNSGRTLMGDVIIRYADPGIPHYDRLIEEIESRPEALAATPVVESFGLLKLPYGNRTEGVQVWGIDPASFDQVVDFKDSLVWSEAPPEVQTFAAEMNGLEIPTFDESPRLDPGPEGGDPGVILGVEIDSAAKVRRMAGSYEVKAPAVWMPFRDVEITLIPISTSGALVALGFTIIYNASDVVNFAQGEFVMLGGMISVAGVAAGLLGIGGGMILGPIFVALDFQPQVGTATTGFMILFTAIFL